MKTGKSIRHIVGEFVPVDKLWRLTYNNRVEIQSQWIKGIDTNKLLKGFYVVQFTNNARMGMDIILRDLRERI